MNTGEIKSFFAKLIGEPDVTFVDNAEAQDALQTAHEQWRLIAVEADPQLYEETVDITVATAKEYDLRTAAVQLFGATPTHGPAMKVNGMEELDGAGDVINIYRKVRSRQELYSSHDLLEPLFYFGGFKIQWPFDVTGTYRLFYTSAPNVTWANAADFVDEFPSFHKLIAYMAYEEYAALDQAFPKSIRDKIESYKKRFYEHCSSGLVQDDEVSYEPNW